jgi:hypothetical protein
MLYPKSKEEITETILEQLRNDPDNPWKDRAVDSVMFAWWATGRTGKGLRLTEQGFRAFTYANLVYYEYALFPPKFSSTKSDQNQYLLSINRKVKCPFYLGTKSKTPPFIRVYDSKIAMLISLYGSLHDYLESVKS